VHVTKCFCEPLDNTHPDPQAQTLVSSTEVLEFWLSLTYIAVWRAEMWNGPTINLYSVIGVSMKVSANETPAIY